MELRQAVYFQLSYVRRLVYIDFFNFLFFFRDQPFANTKHADYYIALLINVIVTKYFSTRIVHKCCRVEGRWTHLVRVSPFLPGIHRVHEDGKFQQHSALFHSMQVLANYN